MNGPMFEVHLITVYGVLSLLTVIIYSMELHCVLQNWS